MLILFTGSSKDQPSFRGVCHSSIVVIVSPTECWGIKKERKGAEMEREKQIWED